MPKMCEVENLKNLKFPHVDNKPTSSEVCDLEMRTFLIIFKKIIFLSFNNTH